ncbi:transcription-repair coupling factor [Desulfoluna spongiiphila]|uniref:Transcription-repair-coupling factor n=1 Tax=Desulfoluna spongiiphila TaxID=419481 RepID=A0A1G5IFV6_9BACT|nr:transcription-repair coupling factor [Desulfoluna spongiiphila]SCY74641.1 transcription-repair coupling factor [Desulfoluna spongiiphila]
MAQNQVENILRPFLTQSQDRGSSSVIAGLAGSEKALVTDTISRLVPGPLVVVLPTMKDVDTFLGDLSLFAGVPAEEAAALFPPYNILPYKSVSYHAETSAKRIRTLYAMLEGRMPKIVVTTVDTLMQRLIPKDEMNAYADLLMVNEEVDRVELIANLVAGGYVRTSIVEEPGDFSVRGGIVDFFSPYHDDPVRVEFFGDVVDSIRLFSASNQRRKSSLGEAVLLPARETILRRENLEGVVGRIRRAAADAGVPLDEVKNLVGRVKAEEGGSSVESLLSLVYPSLDTFMDYLPANALMVIPDPDGLRRSRDVFLQRVAGNYELAQKGNRLTVEPNQLFLDEEDLTAHLKACRVLEYAMVATAPRETNSSLTLSISDHSALTAELKTRPTKEDAPLQPLVDRLESLRRDGHLTWILCSREPQVERLLDLLKPYGIAPPVGAYNREASVRGGALRIAVGHLSTGFFWPDAGLAVITEDEIFGAKRRVVRSAKRRARDELLSLGELKEGDLVVHDEHGIGRYVGLTKIVVGRITSDYLAIEYKDEDRFYLPVDRMGMIQKYVGVEGHKPLLDRMGGKSWDKVKAKAKKDVEKMAGELLKLYSERKVKKGFKFSPSDAYFNEFQASFPYEETRDQLGAIEDVLDDMEKETSMDRLVCGDVGYGKTEVAMRAAFKSVADGKQVAVLVPTTVLAEQHLKTFRERFDRYPVIVESLSRFRKAAEQRRIVEALGEGKVDIVIGTHRLFSGDVDFKDLGLLIIDEEQRFGVRHKEKLKGLKSTVDVLALSATPIPRTLHMSLAGMRDISVISTPPEERQAIISYIAEYDDAIVGEAITRELDRQGQVFFVHNNVASIERMADRIRDLVPTARVGVAHGQQTERELEKVMFAFVEKQIDVLVTTTIIESGLDIPSANTMIVNRADRFGLSQLYQLRGRIGRGDEQAFAYLFVPEEARLSRDAARRMKVLMEHTDLGSGFQIAMSDLQIRGGGAALGASQSGHIAAVGYDMFLTLMDEAISELKGQPKVHALEPEINVNFSTFFPEDYIPDIEQRLVLYRRLARMGELKEIADIKGEIVDRYGKLPEEAMNVLLKIMLRIQAVRAGVKKLELSGTQLSLSFSDLHQKVPHAIVEVTARGEGRYELTPDLLFRATLTKGSNSSLLTQCKNILKEVAAYVNPADD